jgi:carbon storage regulator
MLVLSRRYRETIVIAERIKVTVLAISPNRVDLGIEAPPYILVDREEVHVRRQARRSHASTPLTLHTASAKARRTRVGGALE